MAIPWYSSQLPNLPEQPLDNVFSTDNNLMHNNINKTRISSPINNAKLFSMNSVRDIITKSNNLFKLPEREIDKISSVSGENDDHLDNIGSDYAGHNFYHTGLINKAFIPMRLALTVVGRWPFAMKLKPVTCRPKRRIKGLNFGSNKDGCLLNGKRHFMATRVENYDHTWKNPIWIYFGLTTILICFVLVMSTVGFFDHFLQWELFRGNHWKTATKESFRDNLVVFLVVWGCLLHSALCSISLFINRKRVVRILNFWNVAADELLIDEVKSHRRFLIASNVGYVLFLVLLYFAYSTWQIHLIKNGALLFGVLTILPLLNDEQMKKTEDWELQLFGIVTIIYAIYASRALLILFSFKCRLLRSMFRVWNTRLISFLARPEYNMNEKHDTLEILEKMECQRLLSDMTILLKMVKQMDKMFATVLQAYYAVQLLNMCFELYMLSKSGNKEFTKESSGGSLDIITAVLTFCQNVYFFFTVSLDGAYVGEEAEKGLEVLRRHPITPQMSIQKKYLVYNLGFIYNKRIALTGGKFFTIDRPFIITVLGAVITYFVIILQVEPSLQKMNNE